MNSNDPFAATPVLPPRKFSKKTLVLIIVLLGLLLVCGFGIVSMLVSPPKANDSLGTTAPKAAGSVAPAKPGTAAKAAVKAPAERPGLGDKVRDGNFEFTVSKMDCSKTRVGSQYARQTAQGRYCQVSVTIRNIGQEAQLFDGSSQKAFDAAGVQYSNDTTAEIYANSDSATFLNEINPGNSVKGVLIFDVPKATKLTALELHDSAFSGGVTVDTK